MDPSAPVHKPVRWFIAAAALCGIALTTLEIAGRRDTRWTDTTIAHHCIYPEPLPDNQILGVATAVAVVAALLCFLVGVWLVVRSPRRWWLKASAVVAVFIASPAATFILLMGLLHSEAPTPPSHGIDGSGLPCPFE
ncbi:hypothetical protein ACNQR7_30735 [Mycolicibacterium senegalense]|uniref:hypothetical protein n=1 Tax=Mycobacteriaceae TaxID=1762 RepID=UPI003AAF92A6